jgi:hypothetical protein
LILNTDPGREVEIAVEGRFSVSPTVLMDLRSVPGISEVREI